MASAWVWGPGDKDAEFIYRSHAYTQVLFYAHPTNPSPLEPKVCEMKPKIICNKAPPPQSPSQFRLDGRRLPLLLKHLPIHPLEDLAGGILDDLIHKGDPTEMLVLACPLLDPIHNLLL
jgi:hypothetical protein